MLHASTQTLIQKLCELTEAGALDWREGERQCCRLNTEGYIVEVEAEPPTVRVVDGKGRELERADAADLRATAWPEGGGSYADHVVQMAGRAHRVARGAERAITRILSSLSAPPQKLAERIEAEPVPCAPDFELAAEPKKRPFISAAESDASLAAISADMHRPVETPVPVEPIAPVIAAAPPAPVPPAAPLPVIVASAPQPAPEPAPPAQSPQRVVHVLSADGTVRQPPAANGAAPQAFGSISAFGRSVPKAPTPNFAPGKVTSSGLLMTGIHAVSRQVMVENKRPPQAAPSRPTPEKSSADIYKPWA